MMRGNELILVNLDLLVGVHHTEYGIAQVSAAILGQENTHGKQSSQMPQLRHLVPV